MSALRLACWFDQSVSTLQGLEVVACATAACQARVVAAGGAGGAAAPAAFATRPPARVA